MAVRRVRREVGITEGRRGMRKVSSMTIEPILGMGNDVWTGSPAAYERQSTYVYGS